MTNPVPGHAVSTPYGRRGSYWSCDEDAYGNGIHTGVDYAAPSGTKVVAARPGQVVWSSHGSAFGSHQVDLLAGDGTRDFYAHMRSRVANGSRVEAGDKVGEVGAEGNVTGAHLHFERHATEYGGWSCSVVRDPAPSINYAAAGSGGSGAAGEEDVVKYAHGKRSKPYQLKDGNWYAIEWDPNSDPDWFEGQGIKVGGCRYSATLAVDISGRGEDGVVQTSWVEIEDGVPQETSRDATHGTYNHVVDTRNGGVQEGRRLRARVRVNGHDATLDSADVVLLIFPT